jgi:hypothetical protein
MIEAKTQEKFRVQEVPFYARFPSEWWCSTRGHVWQTVNIEAHAIFCVEIDIEADLNKRDCWRFLAAYARARAEDRHGSTKLFRIVDALRRNAPVARVHDLVEKKIRTADSSIRRIRRAAR